MTVTSVNNGPALASPRRPVLSNQIAQALHAAGIIDADLTTIRHVVLDLESGKPAMLYVEHFADERWLDVALSLDGVQVQVAAHLDEPVLRCDLCHGPGDKHTLLIDAEAKLTRCRDQQTCHARRVT